VQADPLRVVVDLITSVEPGLDPGAVAEIVVAVAGGRAKRRRLAQALAERPGVLVDGRSPAPRAVGDLLIALRKAGADRLAWPCCTDCAKALRSMQRRGQDWYCGTCGPVREPCSVCGHNRPVAVRDQHGLPCCEACRPQSEPDPLERVIEVVRALDPDVTTATVAAAVAIAAPRSGQRRRLAWALAERPDLLTGAGAQAAVPSVLRLIDALIEAGSTGVVRPPCPHCGRMIALIKPRDGLRLCRNCVAKSRAEPCARCGVVREAAARDRDGGALCAYCLIRDPVNQETCTSCGRLRPVAVRTSEGPLCATCRPWKILTCSICGRHTECLISQTTGTPWCRGCAQRWARCAGCGRVDLVRGGTMAEPLCATCTRPDPSFWRTCPTCGVTARLHRGPCVRCILKRRLNDLLADHNGQIRPELQTLAATLAATERPDTVNSWLNKDTAAAVLRDLAAGLRPLTHDGLDELPTSKPVEHLRAVLVSTGALPTRDEQMARLQRWTAAAINARTDPDEQYLLHRYIDWHLIRRLRGRLTAGETTHSQAVVVQQHVRAAVALLDWLTARGLTLTTARQPDLDAWLTDHTATHRREAGHFVRWAAAHHLTGLAFAATRWDGPHEVIDAQARWDQARRLLHEETLAPEDRVAGLLVLLYAQWPATISRLTLEHVDTSHTGVRLRLGAEPVVLPTPLDALVLDLVATRRGHAALGDRGTSTWLFPGGQPGRPISADQLGERLRHLGIRPGKARTAALFQLATELPAALLARMLGIHIAVAVAWQRASAGDWTTYAADVAHRTKP
jgi:hypothetical protein